MVLFSQVEIFRPLHASRSQHSISPEHDGFYLHACHTYHDLPSRYWKKYQYVSEFVSMVRSKTPKVTLFTDQAKCMLMENGPNPDYQVCFYDGEWYTFEWEGFIPLTMAANSTGKLNAF
jgi:hypothetical protein